MNLDTSWILTYAGVLLGAAGVIMGAYSVLVSLSIFKKQKSLQEGLENIEKQKLQYEKNKDRKNLAVDVLSSLIKIKSAIAQIKSNVGYGSEDKEAEKYIEEIKVRKKQNSETVFDIPLKRGVIFFHRMKKFNDDFELFFKLSISAKIFFGEKVDIIINDAKSIIMHLRYDIEDCMYAEDEKEAMRIAIDKIWMKTNDSTLNELERMYGRLEEEFSPLIRD